MFINYNFKNNLLFYKKLKYNIYFILKIKNKIIKTKKSFLFSSKI